AVVFMERFDLHWRTGIWILVLLAMSFQSHAMVLRLGNRSLLESIFSGRIPELARRLPEEAVWVSQDSFVLANELQQRLKNFRVLPPIDSDTLETILRSWSKSREQFIVFDYKTAEFRSFRSGPNDGSMERIEKHIRYYAEVLDERQILSEDGRGPLAKILKIRWWNPECRERCHP
ncbi:MAG: hypothetical protein KGQ59_11805, partial [Bdellovibrionales bacterium]|nr:hypothetical protein [Bdellovibrionales bacterium]